MKLGTRLELGIMIAVLLVAAVFAVTAINRMDTSRVAAEEEREATLHTFRSAQTLKSLIHGYELAINEYYSTVLELPEYQTKATALKSAIDRELVALSKRNTRPETEVSRLNVAVQEIETLRRELDKALTGPSQD